MTRSALFRFAFRTTIPVLLGYSTIGLAYGLLLATSGLPWWLAPLSSVVIYAGAAQFMSIPLLVGGAGVAEIAILTFLVNARHLVYGLSLIKPFGEAKRVRPYLVYALTDETYGLLTTVKAPEGASGAAFYGLVSALDQSYWVLGSLVGAVAGSLVPASWTAGMDFALTALFIVLLVEQIKSSPKAAPYLVALAASIIALAIAGPDRLLVIAIVLAMVGMLALKPLLDRGAKNGSGSASGAEREESHGEGRA
ncbi:MAG TPA: AzlC family ABC transporter permease [Rectinemataceae bacterium]|nr:AzlC family ABC transporter permease [Rectinemataceae bacterium]